MRTPPPVDEVRPDRRQWLLILAFWTLMGLLESSKAYVSQLTRGGEGSFGYALVGNMPWWLFWALVTPAVFALSRRFPLERGRFPRNFSVHLVAAVISTLLHITVVGRLYFYTHAQYNPQNQGYGWMIRRWLETFGMLDLVTYGVIVGVYHALVYSARLRATQNQAARLQVEAAQLEARMTEARLSALRMELNPHFLFNVFNAIAGLVRRQQNTDAVQMLARLGDLLRITLDRETAQKIPLEQEIEFLRLYLEIERIRFHDRLTVSIEVDDDAAELIVPALILQPLVENAIRHGIAKRPGAGRVRVRARLVDGRLELSVSDTGPGFEHVSGPVREGVGLSNTRLRLAQLYGDEAALEIRSDDNGTTVTVRLPVERSETSPADRAASIVETV